MTCLTYTLLSAGLPLSFENKDKTSYGLPLLLPTPASLCWSHVGFLEYTISFLPQKIFVECLYPHSRVNLLFIHGVSALHDF